MISRLQIEGLVVSIVVAIGGLATSGCGSSEKKSESSSSNVEPLDQDDEGPTRRRSRVPGMDDDDDDDDDDVSIEGLKGHLAPYDIQVGMEGHSTALATCFQVEAKRKKFLGGQVELSFTIARDGTVKSVRATKSSVGSWPVEKCLLAESQRMTFKKPKGGEADFSVPLDFEARRVTNWWTEEKAESAIGSSRARARLRLNRATFGSPFTLAIAESSNLSASPRRTKMALTQDGPIALKLK